MGRTTTTLDAQEFAAQIHECQAEEAAKFGRRDRANRHAEKAKRHRRSAQIIRLRISRLRSTNDVRPRARGAGRPKARASSARRSSERSGDSGEDGPSDEPPARRLCAFCGNDIPADRSPKATHCSDRHADRDRQRRKRQRDRARSKLPATPTGADFRGMLEITDEERAWLRALVVCRCNGRHLEFDPGECFRCGRHLPHEVEGGRALYAAFVATTSRRAEAVAA